MSNGRKMEMMSKVDSFWLSLDQSTNLMEIVTIMTFDDLVDFNKLLELLEERLLIFDRFKQKVIFPYTKMGPAYWYQDPHFDILNHVVRIALPSPGDKETLQRLVSDLTVIPLDKNKPLWLIRVIENYNGKGSVVFVKIHHAIADGIALMLLANSFFDFQPNKSFKGAKKVSIRMQNLVEEMKVDARRKRTGFNSLLDPMVQSGSMFMNATKTTFFVAGKIFEKIFEEGLRSFAHPSYAVQMMKLIGQIGLESLNVLLRLTFMPTDANTPFKGRIGVQKSVCWSDPIPVQDVKQIGTALKSTLNDILMSAVTGALRKYIIDVGEDPDVGEIRVSIPVNVRKDLTKIQLGNQFSLVFLSLPVNIEDPFKRLREIRKRMRRIKGSPEAFVGFQALQILGYLPIKLTKKGAAVFASKATGVLTNVPGPRAPLYLTDKEVKEQIFWVPRTSNQSLGISIYSYAGNVTLGISTDTWLIPDPETIAKNFKEEFDDLMKIIKDKNKLEALLRRKEADDEVKEQKIG